MYNYVDTIFTNQIPISSYGYNAQPYGGYYNPYLEAKYRETQQNIAKEHERNQRDTWKMISRNVNKALETGIDIEEHLKIYDPEDIKAKELPEDEREYNDFLRLYQNSRPISIYDPGYYNRIMYSRISEQIQKETPKSMSIEEFVKKSGELYAEAINNEILREKRKVNNLYDRNGYNQLLMNNAQPGSFFSNPEVQRLGITPGTGIDDLEIKLPNRLATEYSERRARFINSILGSAVR